MTTHKDEYRDLLLEVDLDENSPEWHALLNEISESPSKLGYIEPPAGYESQLVAALKTRIPMESQSQTKSANFSTKINFLSQWMASTRLAWSFSGVMAVFVAVLAFQNIKQSEEAFDKAQYDILAQTALRGSSEAVERWLASVADLGVEVLPDSSSGLVRELADVDPAKAQKALEDVARSLGYKGEGI